MKQNIHFIAFITLLFIGCKNDVCITSPVEIAGFFQEVDRTISGEIITYTFNAEGIILPFENIVLEECPDGVTYGYRLYEVVEGGTVETGAIPFAEGILGTSKIKGETFSNDFSFEASPLQNFAMVLYVTDCLDCENRDTESDIAFPIQDLEEWSRVSSPSLTGIESGTVISGIHENKPLLLMGLGYSGNDDLNSEFYSFDGDNWSSDLLPSMPISLTNAVGVYHNNVVIVGLGQKANGTFNSDFYYYDLSSNAASWTQLPFSYPASPTIGATAFVLNNQIYFGLGEDANGNFSNTLYQLNHSGGNSFSWNSAGNISLNNGFANALVIQEAEEVILIGGNNPAPVNQLIEIESEDSPEYKTIANYPTNLSRPQGFSIQDRYFIINNINNIENFAEIKGDSPTFEILDTVPFIVERQGPISFSYKDRGYYGFGSIEANTITTQYLSDLNEFISFD